MLQVHYETEIHAPVEEVWKLFCDIQNYTKHIAYVQKVVDAEEFKEGVLWYDITTVLWVPLKVYHRITTIGKNYLRFDLSGFGIKEEVEEIRVEAGKGNKTHVTMDITFDLGSIFNFLLGKLVQKRLYIMCDKTARNFDNWYKANKDREE